MQDTTIATRTERYATCIEITQRCPGDSSSGRLAMSRAVRFTVSCAAGALLVTAGVLAASHADGPQPSEDRPVVRESAPSAAQAPSVYLPSQFPPPDGEIEPLPPQF